MDRALLNLVGVGLVLFADANSDGASAHARAPGCVLVRCCLEAGVPGLAGLVERVASGLWTNLCDLGPADASLADDLAAACFLLQRHSPPAAVLAAARAPSCAAGRCNAGNGALQHLPDWLAATALIEGSLDRCGLSYAGAIAIFDALGDALAAENHAIEAASAAIRAALRRPALDGFGMERQFGRKHRTGPPDARCDLSRWHDDALDEQKARLSAELGLPPGMIDALIAAGRRAGLAAGAIADGLEEAIGEIVATLDELRRMSDCVGADDTLEERLLHTARLLRDGRFDDADIELAGVVAALDATAAGRDPADTRSLSIAALAVRARVAGHQRDWREAARLYRTAGRAAAAAGEDRASRWRLKLEEARALARLAALPGARLSVLSEAAQVFAEAGGITCEAEQPVAWAEANLELGTLLLALGHRQCRPERFLAAALHFKPALDVLTRERSTDGWARGQIGFAHALRGQGTFQGDVVTLKDAAFAYRAALGVLTRDMTPELWQEASAALGETLVRIAEETGDLERLQEAIDILMPLVVPGPQTAGERSRTIGELALGRAKLLLVELGNGDAGGDERSLLEGSLLLLERVLLAPLEHLDALDRARAHRARGAALVRLADLDPSAATLQAAIEANRRARDLYLALDNAPEAEQIEREMAVIAECERGLGGAAEAAAPEHAAAGEPHVAAV